MNSTYGSITLIMYDYYTVGLCKLQAPSVPFCVIFIWYRNIVDSILQGFLAVFSGVVFWQRNLVRN